MAVRLNPSAAEAYNQLGGLVMRRGSYTEAVQEYSKAAVLKPGEPTYQANQTQPNAPLVIRVDD